MKKGNTIRFSLEEIERLALEDNKRHGIRDDWYKGAVGVNGIDELLALHKREQAKGRKP